MVLLATDIGTRAIVAVVVGAAVLRHLGARDVGTLSVALAFTTVVRAACGLGFDAVMTQRIAADPTPRTAAALAATVARARSWVTVASLPIMVLLGLTLRAGSGDRGVFVLVAVGLLGGPLEVGWLYLLGTGRSSRAVPWRVLVTVLFGFARVGAVVADRSLLWFAALAGAELVLPELVALVVARREGLRLEAADGGSRGGGATAAARLLRGTWAFSLGGLCFLLMQRIDVVLVDRVLGRTPAGRYAAVTRLSEAAFLVGTVVVAIATPHIAARHPLGSPTHRGAYEQLMRRLLLLAIALSALLSLAAPLLVRVLLGPSFAGVEGTLRIHVWSLAAVFVNSARARLAVDEGLLATNLFNGALSAGVNIALNLLLLPHLGVQGAAWATVIAYTASVTLIPQLDRAQRQLQRSVWRACNPLRRVALEA